MVLLLMFVAPQSFLMELPPPTPPPSIGDISVGIDVSPTSDVDGSSSGDGAAGTGQTLMYLAFLIIELLIIINEVTKMNLIFNFFF